MALTDTLTRMATHYSQLAAASSEDVVRAAIYQDIAQAYSQLVLDLSPHAGWSTPTGTLSRSTFDQSTVTLPVLAQHLAALIIDLLAGGQLGP